MTRFKRSAHYRTNSQGTTFLVREHDVSRDEWDLSSNHPARSPEPASAFSATYLAERGIIYPNARCPECQERCYFFKASNGGRVFFDTLWPDWDKHPCTISESLPVMDAAPLHSGLDAEPDIGTDAFDIGAYVRPSGTILSITGDDGTEYLSGDLDLSHKYFPHAWLARDKDKGTGTLSLLSADARPVEVPVKPSEPPKPLTDKTRRELSTRMRAGLIRTAKRVRGLRKSFLRTEPGYGTFVAGLVGDSRVVIVPIPCDQSRWGYDTFEPIGTYMASMALKIVELIDQDSPLKPNLLAQDHVIFAFSDPFGYVTDGMGDKLYIEVDRTIVPDAFEFNESMRMENGGLRNLRWVDIAEDEAIVIDPVPVTVELAILRDEDFCYRHWPDEIVGRWRQIEAFFGMLGLEATFRITHRLLTEAGWAVDYDSYSPQSATYQRLHEGDDSAPGRSARVLFHRSNTESGICFLIEPNDEKAPAQGRLVQVRDGAGASALVRRLGRG